MAVAVDWGYQMSAESFECGRPRIGPSHAAWIAVVALAACTGGGGGGEAAPVPSEPDAGAAPAPAELRISAEIPLVTSVAKGERIQLVARLIDGDDVRIVTEEAVWLSADESLLEPVGGEPGLFAGLAAGEVKVGAEYEALTAEFTLEITGPRLVELKVFPTDPMVVVGTELVFIAEGVYSDGKEARVTERVDWMSTDPNVVTVSNEAGSKGAATVMGLGQAEVVASLDRFEIRVPFDIKCPYPPAGNGINMGAVLPPLRWEGAYRPDGTQFDFDVHDVYCDSEYADVSVIAFIVGAGWCPACTRYTEILDTFASEFRAAGGLLVYVEIQTADYERADNEYAHQHISSIIGDGEGIRVGDAETQPIAGIFENNPDFNTLPSAIVVRKSDMIMIAEQSASDFMLPYTQIAADPLADWTQPSAPPFVSNCPPTAEEIYEPNNTREQAGAIGPGDSFDGGLCTAGPDYYRIEHDGPWRVTVEFSHAEGDIDLFVWHPIREEPVSRDGRQVSAESSDDNEVLEYAGPALLRVQGFQGASATYRLTVEAAE